MVRPMEMLEVRDVRRLALCRAGLLNPHWTDLPGRAPRGRDAQRRAARTVIERFGYLQLDTVSVAGARSHTLVLMSRLEGMDPSLGEELLRPGEPIFEYWGHEVSWMPLDLHPVMEFRRQGFRRHPWVEQILKPNRRRATALVKRIRKDGALRSADLRESSGSGWWDLSTGRLLLSALWSCGELAIRERRNFHRIWDVPERVHPQWQVVTAPDRAEAYRLLLLRALDGHGWATSSTLAATWRLRRRTGPVASVLRQMEERGDIVPCMLNGDGAKPRSGWIRPRDLELAARLRRVRPRSDRGVLLSPFDPVLWDRARVIRLFNFNLKIEIYTPARKRRWGYFCLPVLAGERLVGRVDLKADRKGKRLRVLSRHFETNDAGHREAMRTAVRRHADALGLEVEG
jgi:uncharacterized protein YcaQ